MLMELLFAGRLADYFRAAAIGEASCVFVHVPKTAGTSLRGELARLRPPDANIAVDYRDTSRSFAERMDAAVDAFLAEAPARGIRFASGHLLGRHVGRIRAAMPGARFVTLLRDPVARVVSDYRHQRSPRHPGHAEFAARVPSLEAYLDLPSERNKAAQHLVAPAVLARGEAESCLRDMLDTYAFIGVQEMYPLCFRVLTALAGCPTRPSLRANVGEEEPPEVTPALAARIRELNALDVALHEAVRPRWQRLRDAIEAHLE